MLRQNICGQYINELAPQPKFCPTPASAGIPPASTQSLCPLDNLHHSAAALTHPSGAIPETYDIDAGRLCCNPFSARRIQFLSATPGKALRFGIESAT